MPSRFGNALSAATIPRARARITASGSPLLIAPDLEVGPQPGWLTRLPTTAVADGIARTLAHYAERAPT